jgi:hypothetical protein
MVMLQIAPEDPTDQLARVNSSATTTTFPVPQTPFYPPGATTQQLKDYGFPPIPDQRTQPRLYDFWFRMFDRQIDNFVDPTFDFAIPRTGYGANIRPGRWRTHWESSLNWSGAYITPREGRTFTDIAAWWQVPQVNPPAGSPPGAMFGSSVWVGLDGQRSYFNSTLPQVGTGQFINLPGMPGPSYRAWFQWWPDPEWTLWMPVAPYDLVFAWVLVIDSTHVHMMFLNVTQPGFATFIWTAPSVYLPPFLMLPTQARVSGATAEWITERPKIPYTDTLFELPDYDMVLFEDCVAASAFVPLGPIVDRDVSNPRMIKMYRRATNPGRTVTISMPERVRINPLVPRVFFDDKIRTNYRP